MRTTNQIINPVTTNLKNNIMKKTNLLAVLLLCMAGLQTASAQGFRVYKSDGTVAQFSLRTDSIVFYDCIGTDQDFGPFTPVNQCIVGTWYKSKTDSLTFNEDGTTNYAEGATYEFLPYQGTLIIYNTVGKMETLLRVPKLTAEEIVLSPWGDGGFQIYTHTPQDNNDVNYYSYCPTWKGFTYKTGNYPNYVQGNPLNVVLNPGDSIHVTAHQDKKGHLINATYYTWTICFDTLDTQGNRVHATKLYTRKTNYDGYTNGADDPIGHMLLPAKALPTEYNKPDTVRFVARYSYSGQGVPVESGNIVEDSSYCGRITPQSGSTAGGAAGYFYFNVSY